MKIVNGFAERFISAYERTEKELEPVENFKDTKLQETKQNKS